MNEDNEYLHSLVITANVIGVVYNVPQVVLTIRTKSANDLSFIFLLLRLITSILWLIYTSINWLPDVFISWVITAVSSGILFYYKICYSNQSIWNEFLFLKNTYRIELKNEGNEGNERNNEIVEYQRNIV